jgi:uncharacterized membrane protein YidH (DUF202 family)
MYGLHGYLLTTHSGLRWLMLIITLGSIGYAINGLVTRREIDDIDDRLNKFTVVFAHIQLVIGYLLYFLTNRHVNIDMSDPVSRFWGVEHIVLMTLAIILITIGRNRYKKAPTERRKLRSTAIYFSIALLLMLSAIPWPFRTALGRDWF